MTQQEAEPQHGQCQYRSKLDPGYRCNEPAEPGKDFCIFHDPDPEKDKEKFRRRLQEQIEGRTANPPYSFVGYQFPNSWGEWADVLKENRFEGHTDFRGAQFSELANFREVQFNGDVVFRRAQFNRSAVFEGTQFNKDTVFGETQFNGDAVFGKAQFSGDTVFWGAQFSGLADFRGTQFNGDAVFGKAQFGGDAVFRGTRFSELADFGGVQFGEYAIFRRAEFKGNAVFRRAQFNSDAVFWGAQFSGLADFDAEFNRPVTFRLAQLTNPQTAETAYRKARRSHEEDGDRAEADYYFYLEMVARRRQRKKWWQWPPRFLEWLFIDLTCAYGVSYARVLTTAILIILGAALIVAFAGNIQLVQLDTELHSLHPIQRLLYGGYFSIITFTTLGYGDIHPIGKLTRTVASVEAFIGTFMMALFVVVFARKFMR